MIFVTAGTQLPFDRFVKAIDDIAPSIDDELVVQAIPGRYVPVNFQLVPFVTSAEFERYVDGCSVIVAHAGMGSLLTAMLKSKPVIIFPRRGALGEHRNDHQMATAAHMAQMGYAYVAEDAEGLRMLLSAPLKPLHSVGPAVCEDLGSYIRSFVDVASADTSGRRKK